MRQQRFDFAQPLGEKMVEPVLKPATLVEPQHFCKQQDSARRR